MLLAFIRVILDLFIDIQPRVFIQQISDQDDSETGRAKAITTNPIS
jgi:hypothetical protein